MATVTSGSRLWAPGTDRAHAVAIVLSAVSAASAFGAAQFSQGLFLVWTVPFLVAAWVGLTVRPWRAAGVVGLAYGLALLPAIGLAVHVGATEDRLQRTLVSGQAALFGVPLALMLAGIAAGIAFFRSEAQA